MLQPIMKGPNVRRLSGWEVPTTRPGGAGSNSHCILSVALMGTSASGSQMRVISSRN